MMKSAATGNPDGKSINFILVTMSVLAPKRHPDGGGNHTHRADWFCLYPFMDFIDEAILAKVTLILATVHGLE